MQTFYFSFKEDLENKILCLSKEISAIEHRLSVIQENSLRFATREEVDLLISRSTNLMNESIRSAADWIWMPHPGHFICAEHCRFSLNTCVGEFTVSTIGEYLPPESVREIKASSMGVLLEGHGYDRYVDYMKKIGYEGMGSDPEYKYETMVFIAKDNEDTEARKCCPKTPANYEDIETRRYKTAGEAYEGHIQLCKQFSNRKAKDLEAKS